MDAERCIGAIVCEMHICKDSVIQGYIAMLAVDKDYRQRGIGKSSAGILKFQKNYTC
jgi:peptide alpha-N-acetyltransferase